MRYLIMSIPTFAVTWFAGLFPWGVVVGILSLATFAAIIFYPRNRYIRLHVQTALQGLSYGQLDDAQEHISIAIREAENATVNDQVQMNELINACEKVVVSLREAGCLDAAESLRNRCSKLEISKHRG